MEPVTLVSLVTKPTKVVPRVEEPVPPLATARMPEMSDDPEVRLIAPLNKAPAAVDLTGKAEVKEVIVVEPTTTNGTLGVVVPMPTFPAWVTVRS